MHTTEGELLFSSGYLSEYLRSHSSGVRQHVEAIPQADFDTQDDNSLVARLLADLRVEPLVLDVDNITLSMRDATLDASQMPGRVAFVMGRGPVPIPATRMAFSVPFSGTPDLWWLTPSTSWSMTPRGIVGRSSGMSAVELVFTEPKDSSDDPEKLLKAELELIDRNRDAQRSDIESFNGGLWNTLDAAIKARRQEFVARDELAKRMGVRTNRAGAAITPPVQTSVRANTAMDRTSANTPDTNIKSWDVFVSYASEDREAIARPLAEALRARGLTVWFDKFELGLGDRLRRKLDEGLGNSRFGVVILSKAFFGKHWPLTELDGLAQREVDGTKVILPVWHDIDRDGVAGFSVTLADRVAGNSADGLDHLVNAIVEVTGPGVTGQGRA